MSSISEQLVIQRRQKGLSQEELSHNSGISLRTIQRIEKGEVNPRGHTLKALSGVLEINLVELSSKVPEANEKKAWEILGSINLVSYLVIILPVLHVFLQYGVWYKHKGNQTVHTIGKRVISFQLSWILVTILIFLLIHLFSYLIAGQTAVGHFPIRILAYILLLSANLFVSIRSSIGFNKKDTSTLEWMPVLY